MLHHNDLKIQERESQGVVILDLHGKVEMGKGDLALRDFVQSLLDQGNSKLTMNLAAVSEMDSAGVGLLLFLSQEYQKASGKLVLFHVAHSLGEVYELARLEAVIEIYRDELDAVNSFFPDRTPPRYDILDYVESQTHEHENHKK
jgi:anti-sigma B factor antagonist